MMPDKPWKVAERSLAAILGGERIPNSGFNQADVVAGTLAVQVKYRKNGIPQWILDAVDQSKVDAREGQMPVLVLHSASPGKKARRLVVVELEDLLDDQTTEAEDREGMEDDGRGVGSLAGGHQAVATGAVPG